MNHPYETLRPEYENLLATMRPTRQREAETTAARLLLNKDRYQAVTDQTGVPLILIAALHQRESSADFSTNLAQGDPLTRPSTHVPKGRPELEPGMTFPVGWGYAAVDAIRYDNLDRHAVPWSWPYLCWKGEAWNGFGPRARGIHTGYLWSGTNHYVRGKYVEDGKWDPRVEDRQMGIVPLMRAMVLQDPSLDLPGFPEASDGLSPPPASVPDGVGAAGDAGPVWSTRRLQEALNRQGEEGTPLVVDGNYGRRTRAAVRIFQTVHDLEPDGLAGPLTWAALSAAEERV